MNTIININGVYLSECKDLDLTNVKSVSCIDDMEFSIGYYDKSLHSTYYNRVNFGKGHGVELVDVSDICWGYVFKYYNNDTKEYERVIGFLDSKYFNII